MAETASAGFDGPTAYLMPEGDGAQGGGASASTAAVNESEPSDNQPSITVAINNVVCSFRTRCHLDLRAIALNGCNVEYRRAQGMLNMKLRDPHTTASIWSSGKVTCTGATSAEESLTAARRFARILQKLGFQVRLSNYRIVNVLATCSMPFAILISEFARAHPRQASYEPELHPGVTYQLHAPVRATLKVFSTGSITITAPSVENIEVAVQHIYPLVYEFRTVKKQATLEAESRRLAAIAKRKSSVYTREKVVVAVESEEREDAADDTSTSSGSSDEGDFDSDVSHD